MIRIKIDVSKLDKTAFFKGEKGTYADITLLENKGGPDRFGNDYMVVQDLGKDRRLKGERGAILGNGKAYIHGNNQPGQQDGRSDESAWHGKPPSKPGIPSGPKTAAGVPSDHVDEDVPF